MIRTLIVDDEPYAREELAELLGGGRHGAGIDHGAEGEQFFKRCFHGRLSIRSQKYSAQRGVFCKDGHVDTPAID